MRKAEGIKKDKARTSELASILEKIKNRKLTMKHYFVRKETSFEKLSNTKKALPPLQFGHGKKTKSSLSVYSPMDFYLAGILPKQGKTTVQQLMKMTTNAKALVSGEDAGYHREKVLRLVKIKQLEELVNQ